MSSVFRYGVLIFVYSWVSTLVLKLEIFKSSSRCGIKHGSGLLGLSGARLYPYTIPKIKPGLVFIIHIDSVLLKTNTMLGFIKRQRHDFSNPAD